MTQHRLSNEVAIVRTDTGENVLAAEDAVGYARGSPRAGREKESHPSVG
jgi:hypothetical protein